MYVSPAGSTRKAGRGICSLLSEKGFAATEYDLALFRGREDEVFAGIVESSLLVVGSPVYADHALLPVVELLRSMPPGEGKPAIIFVTYGGVASGSSLYQLYRLLDRKGYRVLGAGEVLSVHSMMFRSDNPVGDGHPDEGDFEVLRRGLEKVIDRIESDEGLVLDVSAIRPARLDRFLDAVAFRPGVMRHIWPRIRFRPDRCDSCGACRKWCPAGRLDDLPDIDESVSCLHCYQCVRHCPHRAFDAPMRISHPAIRLFSKMAGKGQEPVTKFYL